MPKLTPEQGMELKRVTSPPRLSKGMSEWLKRFRRTAAGKADAELSERMDKSKNG